MRFGSTGKPAVVTLGSGLLSPRRMEISAISGLTERYLNWGVPTIHLLNVRALCEESGIPFDPETMPAIGTAAMYSAKVPSTMAVTIWIWAAAFGIASVLFAGRGGGRYETNDRRRRHEEA